MVYCATLPLERSTLVLGAFSGVLGFSGVGLVGSSGISTVGGSSGTIPPLNSGVSSVGVSTGVAETFSYLSTLTVGAAGSSIVGATGSTGLIGSV